jgi:predicted metal-dependent phosphoesterase TrpH
LIIENGNVELIDVDFHCHSRYSPDSINTIARLIRVAKKRGLDKLAITDHNTTRGAIEAHEIDPDFVIVGEEVLTTKGELLALFVTSEVPSNLSPLAAIKRLRKQGAFISVSHPFDRRRNGWKPEDLMEIAPLVDAIEVFNARCGLKSMNDLAQVFAKKHGLAGTAGSDAHLLWEIGNARLTLPDFSNADELREAIKIATMTGKLSGGMVHIGSRWAWMLHQLRKKK